MENRVYEMTLELLEEEVYAFQDYFSNDFIAEKVQEIVRKLNTSRGVFQQTVRARMGGMELKIKNADPARGGSFVSMSNDLGTCVAKSLAAITDISIPCQHEDISTLLSMIDEAFVGLYN